MRRLKYSIVIAILLSTFSFADRVIYGVFVDSKNNVAQAVKKVKVVNEKIQIDSGIEGIFDNGYLDRISDRRKTIFTDRPPYSLGRGSGRGLYIGGSNTIMASRRNGTASVLSKKSDEVRQLGLSGKIGYNFNDILGAEARFTFGMLDKDDNNKFNNIALYLKPNINLTDTINIYGLIGYGKSNLIGSSSNGEGLSYGMGIKYDFQERIGVYWDAINYLEKEGANSIWGANLGLEYQFRD